MHCEVCFSFIGNGTRCPNCHTERGQEADAMRLYTRTFCELLKTGSARATAYTSAAYEVRRFWKEVRSAERNKYLNTNPRRWQAVIG